MIYLCILFSSGNYERDTYHMMVHTLLEIHTADTLQKLTAEHKMI